MKQKRSFIALLGLLLWLSLILLFNRHDLVFYAASGLFTLTLTFLAFSQVQPQYAEIEFETDDDI